MDDLLMWLDFGPSPTGDRALNDAGNEAALLPPLEFELMDVGDELPARPRLKKKRGAILRPVLGQALEDEARAQVVHGRPLGLRESV